MLTPKLIQSLRTKLDQEIARSIVKIRNEFMERLEALAACTPKPTEPVPLKVMLSQNQIVEFSADMVVGSHPLKEASASCQTNLNDRSAYKVLPDPAFEKEAEKGKAIRAILKRRFALT